MMSGATPSRIVPGKRVVVAVTVGLGVLAGLWTVWFLTLLAFGSEGALPPRSRMPEVPPGASVVAEGKECGSGGCWWQLTVTPAAGQSPADLARQMGLAEERTLPPALLDPAFVQVGATVTGERLVVYAGYR